MTHGDRMMATYSDTFRAWDTSRTWAVSCDRTRASWLLTIALIRMPAAVDAPRGDVCWVGELRPFRHIRIVVEAGLPRLSCDRRVHVHRHSSEMLTTQSPFPLRYKEALAFESLE